MQLCCILEQDSMDNAVGVGDTNASAMIEHRRRSDGMVAAACMLDGIYDD